MRLPYNNYNNILPDANSEMTTRQQNLIKSGDKYYEANNINIITNNNKNDTENIINIRRQKAAEKERTL